MPHCVRVRADIDNIHSAASGCQTKTTISFLYDFVQFALSQQRNTKLYQYVKRHPRVVFCLGEMRGATVEGIIESKSAALSDETGLKRTGRFRSVHS